MKMRLLIVILSCCIGFNVPSAFAQRRKSGGGQMPRMPEESKNKTAEKKDTGPKTPADLALDEFNKAYNERGTRDQARFQKVIAAGTAYLLQYPTHRGAPGALNNLAFYATTIDKKQPELRTSYVSRLKLEVTNLRFKEGVSEEGKAMLAALDAAIADFDVRESVSRDNLATVREKIDTLAETPGGGRFLAERERSYIHVLAVSGQNARAEEQARKLLEHKEKSVKDMAREELNILEVRKEPYDLKFTALDGKPVDLGQLRGKVVAMYFWNSTNKGSTDRLEQLKQVHSNYKKHGFEVVTVSYDKEEDREKLAKFVKDNRIAFPVYFDGKGAKNDFSPKLNATAVPRLYVFDQKGILQTLPQGQPIGKLTPDVPMNQLEGLLKRLYGVKS
jgi:peroxiredoxin